jgi:hypothetical protein
MSIMLKANQSSPLASPAKATATATATAPSKLQKNKESLTLSMRAVQQNGAQRGRRAKQLGPANQSWL